MYAKLLVVTVAIVVVAATLLVWRQQRLELSHETMAMHRTIRETRQAIWQQQVEAAWLLAPHRLQEGLDRTQIVFEPAVPLIDTWSRTHMADAHDEPTTSATFTHMP